MALPLPARIFTVCGALSAALAVSLGAAATHLPPLVQAATNPSFQTALQLQQFHALGLIACGLIATRLVNSRWVQGAGILFIFGSLFFSGNLYLRFLAGIDAFRAFVPWGGGAWILGWLALAIGVAAARKEA